MRDSVKVVAYASGAIALVFGCYTIWLYCDRRKYKCIPGRKVSGITGFYFGSTSEILKDNAINKIFPFKLVEDIEKFGPVIKFDVINQTLVHTVDPDAVKEILVSEDFPKPKHIYEKILGFPLSKRLLGFGIFNDTNKERWKHRRALFNPQFYRQELQKYTSIFNLKTDVLIEKLNRFADQDITINLFNEVSRASNDLIAQIAFGIDQNAINDPNNKLNQYVLEVLNSINLFILDPTNAIKPNEKSMRNNFIEIAAKLRKFAKENIMERIKEIEDNEYPQNDILSIILKGADKGEFDMEAMIDDFLTFFVAGQETTSTALTFFFMQIGRHSEVHKRIVQEIYEVLGERSEVTFEDINKLRYTDAAWKESLRLYPPGPVFSRFSTKDIVINGLKVPKNTELLLSPYSSGRCAKFFPNPTKFDPDRFFDEEKKKENIINSYTYFPFSLGSRNCIGMNFATIEAKVIISKLLQRYEFKIDESQSFDLVSTVTLKLKNGLRCYVKHKTNMA